MESRIRGVGLVFKDNKLLLIEQWDNNRQQYFLIPPGGGVEAGESVYETVEREVREESGFNVKPIRLVAIRQFSQSHIDKHSIELFFLCDIVEECGNTSRTSNEMIHIGRIRFLDSDEITKNKERIYPSILCDSKWIEKIMKEQDSKISLLIDKEVLHETDVYNLVPLEKEIKAKYKQFKSWEFKTPPGSLSYNSPIVIHNKDERKVIRFFSMESIQRTLKFNIIVRKLCEEQLGRPIYTELSTGENGKPFMINSNVGFLLQEFRKDHKLDVLSDIRDYDLYYIGRDCGRIQLVLDKVPDEYLPPLKGEHPLATNLQLRVEEIKKRLDPSKLQMPTSYAEWLCSEIEKTLSVLLGLGATEFHKTLIDRDLNVRNASVGFNTLGMANIESIFDPDFCIGSVADSLRNPSLSFASRTPRLTLDEILLEDVNTIGNPRWILFLKGFLEEYRSMSYEEILSIPYFEKLEILIFRLFEDCPRYKLPPYYLSKFRVYTKDIVSRIDNINWHKRLSHFLIGRKVFAFCKTGRKPHVSDTTIESFKEIKPPVPPRKENKCDIVLNDGWILSAEKSVDGNGRLLVQEGYPFPISHTELDISLKAAWRKWDKWNIRLSLNGKLLHNYLHSQMIEIIKRRFPEFTVSYKEVDDYRDLQLVTVPLAENRRGVVALLDPFRYKGDALYVGMYLRMLRMLNPSVDIMVISENEGIWHILDCDVVNGLSDLPPKLHAAVLPIPIDDQWDMVLKLITSLLQRTDLILIPQRNTVIRKHPYSCEIEIFHARKEDLLLEYNNIATYTWFGLHCLLPRPVGLNEALGFLRRVPVHSFFSEERPVFLNPLTSRAIKDLSPQICRVFINSMQDIFGSNVKILINGGDPQKNSDKEYANSLRKQLQDFSNIEVITTGKLAETINILTSVRMVVTADTSIAHAAGLQGVPCVTVWNINNWNTRSSLHMVHNSPAGFSCFTPTLMNVMVDKNADGTLKDYNSDSNRIAMALKALHLLHKEGQEPFFKDRRLDVAAKKIVIKTEETVEKIYSAFSCEKPELKKVCSDIAADARKILNNTKDEWRNWLLGLPVPLGMHWIIDLLDNPISKTDWKDKRMPYLYALDLWRVSSLYKIIRFHKK